MLQFPKQQRIKICSYSSTSSDFPNSLFFRRGAALLVPLLEEWLQVLQFCLLLLQFCWRGGGEGNRKSISLMFPLRRTPRSTLDS
nr:hypothetical protein Iba_scaffold14647CG0130 [Ipomoea batatas]